MMFSERLEYDKYDFQHLQGALRCVYGHPKPDVLRAYNDDQSVLGPNGSLLLSQNEHGEIFRRAVRKKIVDEKIWFFLDLRIGL